MVVDPSKHRLLEAAGREFAEKGFEGASVRSICRRAEMNIAAVNYHFGDKDQLYVEAVFEAHRCGRSPLAPPDEVFRGPPIDQLRDFIREFVDNMMGIDRGGWHEALMFREMMRPTMASGAVVSQAIRPRFEKLEDLLRQLVPGIEGRRLDALAFSIVGQCLFYKVGRPVIERLIGDEARDDLDAAFLTEHITRFTLAAIGHAPPLVAGGDLEGAGVAESKETGS